MSKSISFTAPDTGKIVHLDRHSFAVAALSGGSVWLARNNNGWCAFVANGHINGIMTTERETVRYFSSLDTAVKTLKKFGVQYAAIRTETLK